jgi:hypothetical protein
MIPPQFKPSISKTPSTISLASVFPIGIDE